MTRRVDQGETAPNRGCSLDDLEHVARSVREPIEHLTVRGDDCVDLVAPQRDQPRRRSSRLPAHPARRDKCVALVPSDLTLGRAKVIETSLDLDDQENSR